MESSFMGRISKCLKWRPKTNFGNNPVNNFLEKLPKVKISGNLALITGITIGILAAVAQGLYEVGPPAAIGICAVSHPQSIINWVSDKLFNTTYTAHAVFLIVPALTSVGFILGSFVASVKNKEFKLKHGPVRDNAQAFILGFLIIVFGLLWGSCPIRTAVLVSYGMQTAFLMLGMIVLGVVTACLYIKWKVRRKSK